MKVNTTRFGEIEVPEQDVVRFPYGILGFDASSEYVILNDPSTEPLRWLQSLQEPELAFVIIDPLRFRVEYELDLSDEDVDSLELSSPEEAITYAIVVIPKNEPQKMTANLQGPIVINAAKMIAKQVISTNSSHTLKHYVLEEMRQMMLSRNRHDKTDLKLNRKQSPALKATQGGKA
jgi:flagellar assembly factor FliW